MTKSQINYNLSYAELAMTAKFKATTALRDIEELSKYGITREFITDFKSNIEQLDDIGIDESMRAQQASVTSLKNDCAKQLRRQIRLNMLFVEHIYPANSDMYKNFLDEGISKKSDYELYRVSRNLIKNLQPIAPQLEAYGFSQDNIDILTALNEEFNNYLDNQKSAKNQRNIHAQNRQRIANEVYSQLSKICTYGQTIWFGVDAARYDDYIIYEQSNSKQAEGSNETQTMQ